MSKRSPGSRSAMKAGKAQHVKERQAHRDKLARKAEQEKEQYDVQSSK